ncbi:MAG: RNA polymerase subunit sigma-70 [Hyphomicrobiaceae bacterium]
MTDTSTDLARNARRIGELDIAGGGQVYVQGHYAYIGHMRPPHGTSIIDISEPKAPKLISQIELDSARAHTHKVRVVDDIMITNVEMNDRHAVRRGSGWNRAEADLTARLGRPPSEDEILEELNMTREQLALMHEFEARPFTEAGFQIWDVSNKSQPQLLKHVRTGGIGVHRFDMDARYAYISTEMDGYQGNILVIYDLANPSEPQEVSRWWMPGQHLAGGEKPHWSGYSHRLHHAMREGDELWAAVWHAGLRVIDISDITAPKTIGSYDYHPPFPEPTHTIMKVPFEIGGREIAIAADEEHDHTPGQLHAGLWFFDVTDRSKINAIGMYHQSECDSPYSRKPGRFGLHQFQERLTDTRLYCAWFSGGLRVIDFADPTKPTEVAHFIPEPRNGLEAPQTNDVDVDDRGLIYLLDRNNGLDVVEVTA